MAATTTFGGAASAASVQCNTHALAPDKVQLSTFQIDEAVDAICLNSSQDFAGDVNGMAGGGAFGFDDWFLADRTGVYTAGGIYDNYITFDAEPEIDVSSGFLSIVGPLPVDVISVMVSLKSATVSGLFLMDFAELESDWSIFAKAKDLSHASLFYRTGDVPPPGPNPVPLPASGLMLFAALGGLAMRKRLTRT